jgi:hypothetical protein
VTTFPVAFTPDGQSLVVSWRDSATKGWDVSTGRLHDLFEFSRIGSLAYAPDGRLLAVAGDGERTGTIRLLGTAVVVGGAANTLSDGGDDHVPTALEARKRAAESLAVRMADLEHVSRRDNNPIVAAPAPPPAGGGIAGGAGGGIGGAPLFDDSPATPPVPTGSISVATKAVVPPPPTAGASPAPDLAVINDTRLAANFVSNAANPDSATREITCLAFAPDGQTLVAGEWNHGAATHDMVLWTVANGQIKARLGGHARAIQAVAFSPDGRWLVAVSGDRARPEHDGEAKVWDVHTNQEQFRLVGHSGPILAVAFTPDGRTIITAGADGIVRFWDWPAK